MSLGKLTITLLEAKFTRDVDLIRKMDPYVKFESREQTFKSGVDKKGGKTPKWESDNVFEIDVKYLGDDISFVAKDDDRGRDEKIGEGESKLSAFCCQPSGTSGSRLSTRAAAPARSISPPSGSP